MSRNICIHCSWYTSEIKTLNFIFRWFSVYPPFISGRSLYVLINTSLMLNDQLIRELFLWHFGISFLVFFSNFSFFLSFISNYPNQFITSWIFVQTECNQPRSVVHCLSFLIRWISWYFSCIVALNFLCRWLFVEYDLTCIWK